MKLRNSYFSNVTMKHKNHETSIAVWTYVNIFFGFLILLFSGIAVSPGNLTSINNSQLINYNDQRVYKTPLIIAYNSFSIDKILQDIQIFTKQEGISNNFRIVYLQVIGAYDQTSETKTDGIKRAQEISQKLNASRTPIFRSASTTLSVSNGIPINSFVLKITFATTARN